MNICNCNIDIDKMLCDIPSEWRIPITKALCFTLSQNNSFNCGMVKNCETRTVLSSFTLDGNNLSISYKNERNQTSTKSVDISEALNSIELDPECLMSQDEWDLLTHAEKIEAIIQGRCNCECEETTTTTSTSTTTTTTIPVGCTCSTFTMYNPTEEQQSYSYNDCEEMLVEMLIDTGETQLFCGCSESISYDSELLVLTYIDNGCTTFGQVSLDECVGDVQINNIQFDGVDGQLIIGSYPLHSTSPDALIQISNYSVSGSLTIDITGTESCYIRVSDTDGATQCMEFTTPGTYTFNSFAIAENQKFEILIDCIPC